MVAAEFSEQLKKSILLAPDRFQLLISDVPFEHATPPSISPDKSGIYLVDEVSCGVDWKHTISYWLNKIKKQDALSLDDAAAILFVFSLLI